MPRSLGRTHGICCLDLDEAPAPKKAICSSRMFGKKTDGLNDLHEAIGAYTAPNTWIEITLPEPTAYTSELIQ